MIMKSDINKLVCILFVHHSSLSLENFKDRSLINPEILQLIKLHTYKFGLVYNTVKTTEKFSLRPSDPKCPDKKSTNILEPSLVYGRSALKTLISTGL